MNDGNRSALPQPPPDGRGSERLRMMSTHILSYITDVIISLNHRFGHSGLFCRGE